MKLDSTCWSFYRACYDDHIWLNIRKKASFCMNIFKFCYQPINLCKIFLIFKRLRWSKDCAVHYFQDFQIARTILMQLPPFSHFYGLIIFNNASMNHFQNWFQWWHLLNYVCSNPLLFVVSPACEITLRMKLCLLSMHHHAQFTHTARLIVK